MNNKKIRLSLSENPYKIPSNIKSKVISEIDNCNLYPHDYYDTVKDLIAEKYNLKNENVFITNGSDEAIFLCMLKFANNKKILFNANTFEGYKNCANALNKKYSEIDIIDYQIDLNQYYKEIENDISLIFICNPHNPTGSLLKKDNLLKFVSICKQKNIKVIIDEAYMDYSIIDNSLIDSLYDYDNLIIIKTFSKIFPMAGLRFGFVLSNKSNIDLLKELKMLPYNVNRIACIMAIECLNNNDFYYSIIQQNEYIKKYTYKMLNKLNIFYLNSYTNFITIKFPNDNFNYPEILLNDYNIEIKNLDELGYPGYGRITLSLKKDMDLLFEKIKYIQKRRLL